MPMRDKTVPLGSPIITILMLIIIVALAAFGSNGYTQGKHHHPITNQKMVPADVPQSTKSSN